MQVSVQRLPKSAIKLTISIPADKVKETQEKVLTEIAKEAEIDGFRKGKAPVALVKQRINQQRFDSQVVEELVETYYPQALEREKIAPIISPKIQIENYNPQEDFTFTAETAVKPEITIGDYREAVKKAYEAKAEEFKKEQHRERKEENNKQDDKSNSDRADMTPTDVVDAILSVTQVEIPDMVIAQEVDRMLARLVQQLQPLNLAMESYLRSINKTSYQLRDEYAEVARKNAASEMALAEIVRREQIEVDDREIEATIVAMGDDKLKQRYMENPVEKAYVKAIIAKNKLIWKLLSEVEGARGDGPNEKGKDQEVDQNRADPNPQTEQKDNAKN